VLLRKRNFKDHKDCRIGDGPASLGGGLPVVKLIWFYPKGCLNDYSSPPRELNNVFSVNWPPNEDILSYLFGCGRCHVAVAVDPVLGDEDWFLTEAQQQDIKVAHVSDTHVHADHYSGRRALAEKCGRPLLPVRE